MDPECQNHNSYLQKLCQKILTNVKGLEEALSFNNSINFKTLPKINQVKLQNYQKKILSFSALIKVIFERGHFLAHAYLKKNHSTSKNSLFLTLSWKKFVNSRLLKNHFSDVMFATAAVCTFPENICIVISNFYSKN